jgi:hypothetical protein
VPIPLPASKVSPVTANSRDLLTVPFGRCSIACQNGLYPAILEDMPADVSLGPSLQPARTGTTAEAARAHRDRPWFAGAVTTIVVFISVVLGVRPVSDPSPWLHLKVGAFLLDGGRFGLPDPWAPFAGKAYLPTEWLPAVLGQEIYQAFGLPGIGWMRCAGILGLLSALVWSARRSADTVTAVLVALAAIVGAYEGLTERPQLVGLVFLAVAVGAWWRTALDLKPRWWLVPMTWLWACCHGLWIVGIAVGVVCIAGLLFDRRLSRATTTRLLAIPVLSLAAAGLTPLGPRLLLSPLAIGTNVREFVGEWQSTSVHDPFAVVTLAMLGLVVLSWLRLGRRPPWWQIGFLLMDVVATLATIRTIAVGAVIAAPLLAHEILLYRDRPVVATSRRSRTAWATLIVIAIVAAFPLSAARAQRPAAVPQRLTPKLSAIPSGTVVLAEGDISGWLLWADPGVKSVLDPRIEIYPSAHIHAFVSAMAAGPGWKQFVDRMGARYAFVLTGSPIATALVERAGWSQIGKDAGFVLLRAP